MLVCWGGGVCEGRGAKRRADVSYDYSILTLVSQLKPWFLTGELRSVRLDWKIKE